MSGTTAGAGGATPAPWVGAIAPIAVGIAAITVARSAWLCDDALITFRTLENWVSGDGLRWNVAERVQTYTHPLWLLVLATPYALAREAYYTPLGVSLLVSFATLVQIARGAITPLRGAALVVALASSKTFVDYSTSGLENPATHLLLVLFLGLGLDPRAAPDARRLRRLAALAGLLALNRLDVLLFALPLLARAFAAGRRAGMPLSSALRSLAWGGLPLLAWLAFATFYYGQPLPNTAYAKLDTGIPTLALVRQGLVYVASLAYYDPAGALLLASGITAGALRPELRAAALGLVLHLAYVVWVGGDFMAGRFFSASVVGATVLLGRVPASPRALAAATTLVVLVSLASPFSSLRAGASYRRDDPETIQRWRGIADERGFYFQGRGLIAPGADHDIRPRAACREPMHSVVIRHHCGGLGYDGYVACSETHLVDRCALTDPLLARLPTLNPEHWRVGHYFRRIPKGYPQSLETDQNAIRDPQVHSLYEDIRRATRDPLLSRTRASAALRLLRP